MVSGKTIGIIAFVALILLVGIIFLTMMDSPENTMRVVDTGQNNQGQVGTGTETGDTGSDSGTGTDSGTSEENIIEITSSGFSPSTLTISQGEKVTFINMDSRDHWPASDIHPTHTVYPGSSISKCGTVEEDEIFDACHGLATGEEYSFTFNEVGTWHYHDHLRSSLGGTIIVQ